MISFKKLTESATTPKRATEGSAGFDLYFSESKPVVIPAGMRVTLSTGIACKIPMGFCGQIWPRSGLASRGIDVLGGLIDCDYRGEIKVMLINHSPNMLTIDPGERIAQLVVSVFLEDAQEVEHLDDTERGTGGFGSTGK